MDMNSSKINIPEKVSQDGAADLRLRGSSVLASIKDQYTSGLIKPFKKPELTHLSAFMRELRTVIRDPQSKRIMLLGMVNVVCLAVLFVWCRSTNSMALTAYTYLTIFDIMMLLTCLLSIWVEQQKPTPSFTFGYERFEVLAIFASTILTQLGSLFIIKESIERIILLPTVIHTSRLIVGAAVAFVCHLIVTYGSQSRAWNHMVAAASSSWLQEHVADISQSVCHVVPGLSRILLPRANPMILIAFAGATALLVTHLLVEMNDQHVSDTVAAICIALMTCGTMFPMSVYSGKILLQTSPSHIVGQLDKCLREASTLDGVLEFRNEHFWTLSFGSLAGSLHVRVRRDANEQLVLAHLVDRLANLVTVLTVQVFKDDWTRSATTLQLLSDTSLLAASSRVPGYTPTTTVTSLCTSFNSPAHQHVHDMTFNSSEIAPQRASAVSFTSTNCDASIYTRFSRPTMQNISVGGSAASATPTGDLRLYSQQATTTRIPSSLMPMSTFSSLPTSGGQSRPTDSIMSNQFKTQAMESNCYTIPKPNVS